MEINELQIGDWVEVGGIPRQIKLIDDCINHKIIAHGVNKDGRMVAYVGKLNEEVKPIPLTPEVLEKNFESKSNVFGLQTYKLSRDFYLENRGDRFCLLKKCNVYNHSTFWICDLAYLHQLRLYGIEKEIKL
jgi:hypothetical protein